MSAELNEEVSVLPGFQFGEIELTDEELAKETARRENRIPTYKKVDLKILKVEMQKANDNDPTWINAFFTFGLPTWKDSGTTETSRGGETVTVYHDENDKKVYPLKQFMMIPTQSIYFNSANGNRTLMVFTNLQRFFAGLGVDLKPSKIAEIIPYYFAENGKALTGLTVAAFCGYETAFIDFVAEDESYAIKTKANVAVVLPEGKVNKFDSREEAIEAGLDAGMDELVQPSFSRILKFYRVKNVKQFDLTAVLSEAAAAAPDTTFDD